MTEHLALSHSQSGELPVEAPDQGFKVEMLAATSEKLPSGEVLAGYDEILSAYRQRYQSGDGVRVLEVGEQPKEYEERLFLFPQVRLREDQYREIATQTDHVPPYLTQEQAEMIGLAGAFKDEEARAIEEAACNPNRVVEASDADYALLESGVLQRIKDVRQVFELSGWGREVRLYNFTDTPLDELQMKKISNALRQTSDLTGCNL